MHLSMGVYVCKQRCVFACFANVHEDHVCAYAFERRVSPLEGTSAIPLRDSLKHINLDSTFMCVAATSWQGCATLPSSGNTLLSNL